MLDRSIDIDGRVVICRRGIAHSVLQGTTKLTLCHKVPVAVYDLRQ